MKNKKVGIYARVSTNEQKKHGFSIETQIETLKAYAKANNMKVVDIYADEGYSGAKIKRPQLQRLLKDIEDKKVEIVLFVWLDRWFRSVAQYHKIQEILETNGAGWICTDEDYETITADGKFKVNIMLSVAQQYRDKQSEKVKYVFDYKVKNGYYTSTSVPFGYTTIREAGGIKVVKDKEKEHIVYDFYDNFKTYNSIRKAQIYINTKYGLSTTRKVIQQLIDNDLYCGEFKGIKDFTEPYLTREELEHIRSLKKKNIKQNKKYDYIFSGLLICKECGKHLKSCMRKEQYVNLCYYKTYRCQSHQLNKSCDNKKMVYESYIEKELLKSVKTELQKYIYEVELNNKKIKKSKSVADREEIQKEIDRLNNMYQKGRIKEDLYDKQYEELEAKLNELEKEKCEVDTTPLNKILEFDFNDLYKDMNDMEKQIFWRSFIDYIEVDKNRNLTIHFL